MKSRKLWVGMMVLLAMTFAVTPAAHAQDLPKVDVDIHTNHDGGGDWYKNPVVIGGGIAVLFLLAILAGRSGGTTVVKS